jgi:hypothetical protein
MHAGTKAKSRRTQGTRLDIAAAKKVKVSVLEVFPLPDHALLHVDAERMGMVSKDAGGKTNGYVILLKRWTEKDADVLTHELVHVLPFESMEGVNCLRRYIIEQETMGYARSSMELEAYEKQHILRQK